MTSMAHSCVLTTMPQPPLWDVEWLLRGWGLSPVCPEADNPEPMKKRGIGRSAKEGGMLLSRVVVAKKNDIRESAANVLLLNMAF